MLWYVRVASLLLRFSDIVRRSVFDRPVWRSGDAEPTFGWLWREGRQPSVGFNRTFGSARTQPSVRFGERLNLRLPFRFGWLPAFGLHTIPTKTIGYEYRQPAGCVNVGCRRARILLTSALPRDGRSLASLFLHPERGPESGIAFWSNLPGVEVGHPIVTLQRLVKRRGTAGEPEPRSGAGWNERPMTGPGPLGGVAPDHSPSGLLQLSP